MRLGLLSLLALGLLAFGPAFSPLAAQEADRAKLDFFESKIRPLFLSKCVECHGPEKQEGNLRLDSHTAILQGGDYGPAVKPGAPDDSWIIKATRYNDDDLKMPPTGKLAPEQVAALEKWVADGAVWPAEDSSPSNPPGDPAPGDPVPRPIGDANFWSFQPVAPPQAPEVADAQWSATTIDRFILAKLEANNLHPVKDADRATLLRRVTLDLTGLPPTPQEVEAFLADDRTDAYERLVDRLLASSAFGERFGRHWLDVTYFADTTGVGRRAPLKDAWRYRDYIIAAYNADMPYAQFVREQLAGDLLPAADDADRERQLVATGFLVLGPWHHFAADREQMTMDIVDLQIDAVGRTFMGMTLGCARCHDHKFDPITAKDYYALAGIFKSTQTVGREGGWSSIHQDELPQSPADVEAYQQALKAWEDREKAWTTERAEAEKKIGELEKQIASLDAAPAEGTPSGPNGEKTLAEQKADLQKQIGALRGRIGQIDGDLNFWRQVKPHTKRAFTAADRRRPDDARINLRGNVHVLGDAVPRGFPEVLRWEGVAPPSSRSSGRLELAQWLTDPRHPLASRVYVNRLWRHLFGAGIVPSVDNFGTRGDLPSHPELLDYLAHRFIELNGSTKAILREIVLSRVYRLDSRVDPAAAAVDPDNRLLWRMTPRRLEAETIRDSVLAVSGRLDFRSGGPTLPITRENLHVNSPSFLEDDARIEPHVKFRRSVYMPIMRGSLFRELDVLTLFDFADPDQIVGARAATTVPTQALFLLNSDFIHDAARGVAQDILAEDAVDDSARIQKLYLKLFGRAPRAPDLAVAAEYLQSAGAAAETPEARENAWTEYCRALLISAEFLFRR